MAVHFPAHVAVSKFLTKSWTVGLWFCGLLFFFLFHLPCATWRSDERGNHKVLLNRCGLLDPKKNQ